MVEEDDDYSVSPLQFFLAKRMVTSNINAAELMPAPLPELMMDTWTS